jgi:hypothetical protein
MDAYMAGKKAKIIEAQKKITAASGTQQPTAIVPATVHLDAPTLEALARD